MSDRSAKSVAIGIGAGVGLGLASRLSLPSSALTFTVEWIAQPIGQLFLRLLFLLAMPVVLSALMVGVAELDAASFGRLGLRTLGLTVLASVVSVVLGVVLVEVLSPGSGATELALVAERFVHDQSTLPVKEVGVGAMEFVRMIPDNPFAALAGGDMLGVIVFSLLFGFALGRVDTPGSRQLLDALRGVFDVTMYLLERVIALAPLGVGALLFSTVATVSLVGLQPLLGYAAVVVGGLCLQLFGTYSLMLLFLAKRSPLAFLRAIRLPLQTAFATASSSATLPIALEAAEKDLKLGREVSRFVLTAGASMNQNGTALFEGVTVLFLAQVFGIELSFGQSLSVMVVCVLGGIGTAGVPGASIPVIALLSSQVGVPKEAVALILGVDRVLDMCRTTLNVAGDLVIAACVDAHEKPKAVHEKPQAAHDTE